MRLGSAQDKALAIARSRGGVPSKAEGRCDRKRRAWNRGQDKGFRMKALTPARGALPYLLLRFFSDHFCPLMAAVLASIGVRKLRDVNCNRVVLLDRQWDSAVHPPATHWRHWDGMRLQMRFLSGLDRFLADEPDLETLATAGTVTKERPYLRHERFSCPPVLKTSLRLKIMVPLCH